MKQYRSVPELQAARQTLSGSVGFVPTMGGLHQGHISLIQQAQVANDYCIVSLYLNETQFDDASDLKSYPAHLDEDLKILDALGVDLVFLPSFQDIYPDDYTYRVSETTFSRELCGKSRPGHFDGVLTVVLKLLNLTRPTNAYFGEKDFQQLELIQGMVASFFLPVKIVPCPIVRDEEGLALSSRNRKLNSSDLSKAHFFAKALKEAQGLDSLRSALGSQNITVDYLVEKNQRRFAAVKIGNVRLIDNVAI